MTPKPPDEFRNRATAYLRSKGFPKPCFVCETNSWTIEYPVVIEGLDFEVDGKTISNNNRNEALKAVCDSCGQIVLFDAMRSGLIFHSTGGLSYALDN
jgi:hypothetical protein